MQEGEGREAKKSPNYLLLIGVWFKTPDDGLGLDIHSLMDIVAVPMSDHLQLRLDNLNLLVDHSLIFLNLTNSVPQLLSRSPRHVLADVS